MCLVFYQSFACESPEKGLNVKFQSYENTQWDGTLEIPISFCIGDSIDFLDSFDLDSLNYGMSIANPLNLGGNSYSKGDTIDTVIVINYDTTYLPFYPIKKKIRMAYTNELGETNLIKSSFWIYFTPYYTVEVWDASDFNQKDRIWILGDDDPGRTYVNPANIPVSNIPANFELNEDWEDNFSEWRVPGLAYAVPMKAIDPDSVDTTALYNSFLLYRYRGTITGNIQTQFDLEPDYLSFVNRPLAGIRVEFWQEGWPVAIGIDYTDMEGNFSIPIDFRRNSRDIDVFIRLKARNAEHDIRAYTSWPYFSVAQFNQPSVNLERDRNGPEDLNFNIIINEEPLKAVSLLFKSWEFFEGASNSNFSLESGLNVQTGTDKAFFWPDELCAGVPNSQEITLMNTVAFFKPHMELGNDDLETETTAWHEFGHFVMWQLQDKCYTELLTASGKHSFSTEENPRLAWTEGFANAWSALTDLHYHFLDMESSNYRTRDMEDDRKWEDWSSPIILNGVYSEYLIGRTLRDLFDGTNQVTNCYRYNSSLSPQPSVLDVGSASGYNWDAGTSDNVELDINIIFQAIANGSNRDPLGNGQVSSIIDFYENLIELVDCDERLAVKEVFEQNRIVLNRGTTNEIGLSADRLWDIRSKVVLDGRNENVKDALNGYDYILQWAGFTDFTVDFVPYYLHRDEISSNSVDFNLAQLPGGSSSTCLLEDISISGGGKLQINDDGYVETPSWNFTHPPTGSHFQVFVQDGTFEIADGGSIIFDEGLVEVGDENGVTTGELIFQDDALPVLGGLVNEPETLRVHSGSRVVFEQNADVQLGSLVIELTASDAEVVFKTGITVLENAHPSIQGTGVVRFEGAKDMFSFEGDCSMEFKGPGFGDYLQIIVDQNDLYFLETGSGNTNEYDDIILKNADVQLADNSRICVDGSLEIYNVNFSPLASGDYPRGLYLYGQDDVSIEHADFNNLKYGIHYTNYLQHQLELVMCDFNDCKYGLYQSRHSAEIIGGSFTNCDIGWYSTGAGLPGYMASTTITGCDEGILFMGNTNLHLNGINIHHNIYRGVNFYGRTLSSWCGHVDNNYTGLLGICDEMILSSKFKPYTGHMTVENNRYGLAFDGIYLRLNNGKNDLVSVNPLWNTNLDVSALHESWVSPWGGMRNHKVFASGNKWDNSSANNFPDYQTLSHYGNHQINRSDPISGTVPSTVISYNSITSVPQCPAIYNPNDPNFTNGFIEVENEWHNDENGTPTLDVLASTGTPNHEFQGVSLQAAVSTSVQDMYNDGLSNRYTTAANRMADILLAADNTNWEYPDDEYVSYVLDYTYLRMMEAFEYACLYENGLIPGSVLPSKIIGVQEHMIALVDGLTDPNLDLYYRKFKLNLDLSTTAWLTVDYIKATSTLNDMQTWTTGNEQTVVLNTLCMINYENDILTGVTPLEDVDEGTYPCQTNIILPPIVENEVTGTRPFTQNEIEQGFELYPNPSKNVLHLRFVNDRATSCSAVIYDQSGKEISRSEQLTKDIYGRYSLSTEHLQNGLYMLEIISKNTKTSTQFSVMR